MGLSAILADLPHVDGHFIVDPARLADFARDAGGLVRQAPLLALIPSTVADVRAGVRLARRWHLPIAVRGAGHCRGGQSQAAAGLVIAMEGLDQVHGVDVDRRIVDVAGGALWHKVLQATGPLGLTAPTMTDWLHLTVGGTVSTGGVGAQAFHAGIHADQIVEAQVVTGAGEIVTCSASEQQSLFDAVRAGLGQFGVIVRLKLRLVSAPPQVRVSHRLYTSLEAFLSETNRFVDDRAADGLLAHAVRNDRPDLLQRFGDTLPASLGKEPWLFVLETAQAIDSTALPTGEAVCCSVRTYGYEAFVGRSPPIITVNKGQGPRCHPAVYQFVPTDRLAALAQTWLPRLQPESVGTVLFIPMNRSVVNAPLFQMPDSERFWLFGVLGTAPQQAKSELLVHKQRNLDIYEAGQRVGAVRYPCDSLPQRDPWTDWSRDHYGPKYKDVLALRRRFDPDQLLSPNVACPSLVEAQ